VPQLSSSTPANTITPFSTAPKAALRIASDGEMAIDQLWSAEELIGIVDEWEANQKTPMNY
jgi:hypothetical protein